MSGVGLDRRALGADLEGLVTAGRAVARRRATRRVLPRALELGLYGSLVLPLALGLGRLLLFVGGPVIGPVALWPVLLGMLAGVAGVVGVSLWAARRRVPERSEVLGEFDAALGGGGRLLAADDFLRADAGGPFVLAALEDGAGAVARAREVRLAEQAPVAPVRGSSYVAAAAALALAWLVVGGAPPAGEEVALGGVDERAPALELPERERPDEAQRAEEPPTPEPRPEAPPRDARRGERAESAAAVAPVSDRVKDSKGRTKSGQSSSASSASGASASRGTPSNQTQESRETEEKAKTGKKSKKEAEEPEADETRKEDSASGATAGRGSGSGSTKNPSTTDWSSKDHVESQEEEDEGEDADVEDEDSDSEARGGVQPSLRDRRPPVNRDLQIGFGAGRPNPDANGRGGPSPQKKSRGVASLVLGVPIPDHVKGRANPGRTKVTQERVEPESEDSEAAVAAARRAREGTIGDIQRHELTPWMRELVRAYFKRTPRARESRPTESN